MSFFTKKAPTAGEIARENFIKSSITDALAQTLKTLQKQYVNTDQPIYSEDSANAVCNVVEAVFIHGLKSSFSTKLSSYLVGVDPDKTPQPCFWELLKRFTHKDVFSQLNHLGQITSEIGMCRAWIRMAINDGVLESYLDAMLAEPKTIRYFYNRTAYLRDTEHPGILKTYIQGLQNFRFQLSYNSSMLNIFTTTPLVLAGIEEAQFTPQSSMIASRSDEAVSANATDATKKTIPVRVQHGTGPQKTAGGSRVKASSSGIDGLATPPNTPYDNTMLTRKDVDEIRRLGQLDRDQYSVSSTPTSQVSCPDPTDSRHPELNTEDTEPIASGVSKSKRQKVKSSKIKSMFPEVLDENAELVSARRSPNLMQVANPDVEKLMHLNNGETASLCSYGSNLSEGQLDANSISSAEKFFSQPESETSSMAGVVTGNGEQLNNVHVLEEENLKAILSSEEKVESFDEQNGSVDNGIASNDTDPENGSTSEPAKSEENAENTGSSSKRHPRPGLMPNFNMQRRKSKPLEPVLSDATATSEFVEIAQDAALQLKFSPTVDRDELSIYDARSAPPPQGNKLGDMDGWSSPPNHDTHLPYISSMADLPDMSYVENEIFADILSAQSRPEESNSTSTNRSILVSSRPTPVASKMEHSVVEDVTDNATCSPVNNQSISGSVPIHREIVQSHESFNTMVQDYGLGTSPANVLTISQVINQIPGEDDEDGTAKSSHKSKSQSAGSFDDSCVIIEEYDVVALSDHLVTLIGELTTEKGLDQQNYQCESCARPIGMIYGNPRLCNYDSCYYCYECHENQEYWIPSRIVHNWDFQKYKVSNGNLQFLKQSEEEALLHIQNLNPRLYDHVSEITEVHELRLQLRFLKAYLFTCTQSVADDLRKQVWPREYLYDDIHLYSLQDLIQIQTGILAQFVKKVIKDASKHVLNCGLCSQKGFICEICNSLKVIYPFEMETTIRCDDCGAVYHKTCRANANACVKCRRIKQRKMSLGNTLDLGDNMDYAIAPNIEE